MTHHFLDLLLYVPAQLYRRLTGLHDHINRQRSRKKMRIEGTDIKISKPPKKNAKKRILFYHISGLSFGGTEKHLQILAKHLNIEDFDIFYLYSPKSKGASNDRSRYFDKSGVTLIPFNYDFVEKDYAYIVHGTKPSIFEVIRQYHIDLMVTADAGYAHFPINLILNIPIVLINVFGAIHNQQNIMANICMSHMLANKIHYFVPKEKLHMMYIPSESPDIGARERGLALRRQLNIKESDMVFGRIGRASDSIFDPIGIRAFKRLVAEDPTVHYLIMSPPPCLESIVKQESIANVHFLPPTSNESEVWAFHNAIDALAHFRKDGETFGLNIAEAMLCGKPILTHISKVDNAHLEYLEPAFSLVAPIDNIEAYYQNMKEFTKLKKDGALLDMGKQAKIQADKLFLIDSAIIQFETILYPLL